MPTRAVRSVELLVRRSHQLGSDAGVLARAAGRTSAKSADPEAATGTAPLLHVSRPGADLSSLTRDGLATLDVAAFRAAVASLCEADRSDPLLLEAAVADGRCWLSTTVAPAAETAVHALLPHAHVDLMRTEAVLALAVAAGAPGLVARCFDGHIGWMPERRRGLQLALDVAAMSATDPKLRGVVIAGHGLVTWGATSDECLAATRDAVERADRFVQEHAAQQPVGPVVPGREPLPDAERIAAVLRLFPLLRRIASAEGPLVGHYDDDALVLDFLSRSDAPHLVQRASEGPQRLLPVELRTQFLDPPGDSDGDLPQPGLEGAGAVSVFLVPGVGLFAFGRDKDEAIAVAELCSSALKILYSAEAVSSYGPVAQPDELRIPCVDRSPRGPLSGRVALVTGGGSGIGRATAQRLAEHGACVVVADIDLAAAEKTTREFDRQTQGLAVEVDVRVQSAVQTAVEATVLAFGGVDLLVNNAGLSISKPLQETTVEDWDIQHDVMARGSFLMTQAAAAVMAKQGIDSDIVYVVSKNAAFAGPNNLAYGAAKANQAHQVRLLAAELGPLGVRVNGVSPDGVVQGSGIFANGWGRERAKVYGVPVDELGAFYAQRTLLKREVLPSHVADAVLALTSGLLSRTTGAVIPVDGGVSGAFLR